MVRFLKLGCTGSGVEENRCTSHPLFESWLIQRAVCTLPGIATKRIRKVTSLFPIEVTLGAWLWSTQCLGETALVRYV